MSPKRDHTVKSHKKSLSRLVLEANTFAKTKHTLELLEAESSAESRSDNTETNERNIECTPMKALKQVPCLMDVTLSPIVNQSILQSSNDSVLTESVEKQSKDCSNTDVNLKPLPAFAPLQETYYEKSVLRSYQSSVGDSSMSITEEREITKSVGLIPMPAFTTIHEDFGRSVLHSYESSVAESSQSIQEETSEKCQQKPISTETLTTPTEFGSVLHSHQSSLAVSQPLNVSSLITDDSDVEMTETENQERAEQKEKEQIVEIEREIHEIEDMSNENESEEESDEESSEESDVEHVVDIYDTTDSSVHVSSGDSDSESEESSPAPSNFDKPLVSNEMLDKIMEAKYQSTSKKTTEDSNDSSRSKDVESCSDNKSEDNNSESDDSSLSKKLEYESDDSNKSKNIESDSNETTGSDQTKEKLGKTQPEEHKETTKDKEKNVSANIKVTIEQAQISMITEDDSIAIDKDIEVSAPIEVTNPLDQAQVSIMTDDNSTIVDDGDVTKLTNDPVKTISTDKDLEGVKTPKQVETTMFKFGKQKTTEPAETSNKNQHLEEANDPLAQVSLITEDNSSFGQELSLNYSDEKIEMPEKGTAEVPGKV